MRMMSIEKKNQNSEVKRTVLSHWAWAYPTYEFSNSKNKSTIKKITIDPSGLMADIKQADNTFEKK
jgi:hypothetical protein